MTITQFGRVEFDPMRVPISARAPTRDIPSFDDQFQSEITQGQRFKPAPPNEVDEQPAEVVPSQPAVDGRERRSSQVQQGNDASAPVEARVVGSTAKTLPSEGQEPKQETIKSSCRKPRMSVSNQ